jgi:predicted RNase H-like HicB family nuclease
MHFTILLEPASGQQYRASCGSPLDIETEGASREEALGKLRELIEHKIRSGVEILTLEVDTAEHPWKQFAGTLKDDPLFEEWVQAMAQYRASIDDDPNAS